MKLASIRKTLRNQADPRKAVFFRKFFKTGKGEYAEGDQFLGLTVPQVRSVARQAGELGFADLQKLLTSRYHEERLLALVVLVKRFEKEQEERGRIYRFYLKNKKFVNHWDLVDCSAPQIVGGYLENRDRSVLVRMARSRKLWERRIAVLATFHFIRRGEFADALRISELLVEDGEDLIHKAVGWMLREIGKRDRDAEERFLKRHYRKMPRTMLRYAVEKFPEKRRKAYLNGRVG